MRFLCIFAGMTSFSLLFEDSISFNQVANERIRQVITRAGEKDFPDVSAETVPIETVLSSKSLTSSLHVILLLPGNSGIGKLANAVSPCYQGSVFLAFCCL